MSGQTMDAGAGRSAWTALLLVAVVAAWGCGGGGGERVETAASGGSAGGTGTIVGRLDSAYVRVADGLAYVVEVPGSTFPPPDEQPIMDQKDKVFTPHVLPVLQGTTVAFPNTDDVRHDVYSREDAANEFRLGKYDPGVVKHVTFPELGVTHLGCHVHAEMSGYIIALQNPYHAIIDRNGQFRIEGVPVGTYALTFFHERIVPKTLDVTVRPGQETTAVFENLAKRP